MNKLIRVEGVGEHPYTTCDWGEDKDKKGHEADDADEFLHPSFGFPLHSYRTEEKVFVSSLRFILHKFNFLRPII